MASKPLSKEVKELVLTMQKNEITEYTIYKKLVPRMKKEHNKKVLKRIAAEEWGHYLFLKKHSKQDVKPNMLRVWIFILISRIIGITFGVKLMEKVESNIQISYKSLVHIPGIKQIIKEENQHEQELINVLKEEKLKYIGSIVLGLNDALVELTGALAGLTFALQNTSLVALTGFITGFAAALSMGVSEYLSTKAEESKRDATKAAVYTGIAYIITVLFLIFPYVLFDNVFRALGLTLINALIIIFAFTFYVSITKDESFKHKFLEMATLSFSVALLSFGVGWLLRTLLGIEV